MTKKEKRNLSIGAPLESSANGTSATHSPRTEGRHWMDTMVLLAAHPVVMSRVDRETINDDGQFKGRIGQIITDHTFMAEYPGVQNNVPALLLRFPPAIVYQVLQVMHINAEQKEKLEEYAEEVKSTLRR